MAGLLQSRKDRSHNDRSLVTVDLGWRRCSVKLDVDRVGSRIVAKVCSSCGFTLSFFGLLKRCVSLGSTTLWVAIFWVPIVG